MIEAIYDVVFFVAYLGFFLGYGAIWLVVPTLIVYALSYRLKKKDYNNKSEKKAIKADVKGMKKLINAIDKDINWVIKRIKKRA